MSSEQGLTDEEEFIRRRKEGACGSWVEIDTSGAEK